MSSSWNSAEADKKTAAYKSGEWKLQRQVPRPSPKLPEDTLTPTTNSITFQTALCKPLLSRCSSLLAVVR